LNRYSLRYKDEAMSLQGQVALVSGASRGIGQAIAKHLAQIGATVVGTATTQAGADAISQYLSDIAAKGKGVVLNVNDAAQIEAVIEAVQAEFGAILILVNNAGITRDNLLMRMKDEEWDDILDTNLRSVFRLSRGVLRGMMKVRAGRIINISSVVGAAGNAGQTNYAAAKAGMIGFTKALAREVGSRNITVNCVAPGLIDTDMTRALTEEQHRALLTNIPLSRLGSVEDIAAAVGYLVSPGAAYVTGTTLHVNGGMFMG
jgi:3-oxoacyl-[acyl-carrier protein] reductase